MTALAAPLRLLVSSIVLGLSAPEPSWIPLSRQQLCVTHGSVETDASGRLSISDPVVRAVSSIGKARAVELRFTLLGPTDETVPLRSGQIRRQLGLKLRARDGCNLVYAMWRLSPRNELVVSVKSNPGMRTRADCSNGGYRNVRASASRPIPVPQPGEPHRLRAVLAGNPGLSGSSPASPTEGDALEVFIDEVRVWKGLLPSEARAIDGPVGLRTDNLRLLAELSQLGARPASDGGFAAPDCGTVLDDNQ